MGEWVFATYFIELNDIWMPDYFQNVDLPCNSLHITLILNLVLLKDLNRNLLACNEVCAEAYLAECALPQRSTYKTIVVSEID